MKFNARHEPGNGLVTVTGSDNCDTDSWPLVPEIVFRQYQGSYDPETVAIASTILFSRHCGSVAEFNGAKVGIDAARAVRAIVPDAEDILPIDGMRREIGQGVASLVVGEAERILCDGIPVGRIGRSARAVTWSGDFVSPARRESTHYIGGSVFTNARLVAASTNISVALALLIGGRALRDIYVPAPADDEAADFERIAAGLEFISIKLRAL